ncbi:MAG: zinc-dependent alcohol dehydrogenase [Candidatus Brocadiia bacterium]
MQAAVLDSRRSLSIRELDDPPLRPGHVAVAPKAVGICGTDLHVYLGTMEHRVAYPAVLGHEFAGLVVEVADEVEDLEPGQPVVVDPVLPCGRCRQCAEGRHNVCRRLTVIGIDCHGGMCQRAVVPAPCVHPFPASVPIHFGAMAELYSVGVHASRRTGIEAGDFVVILGAGKLGLTLLDVMRLSPARTIVSVDVDPFRLEVARQLGADLALDPRRAPIVDEVARLTDGRGADKVVEAVGHPVAVEGQGTPVQQAFETVRPGGQVTVMGQGEQTEEVFWREFVLKEATVVTSRLNLGDFPRAIEFLESGRVHPQHIITHRVPLAEAPQAFADLAAGTEGLIKVVVEIS